MRGDVRDAVLDCGNYVVAKGTQSGRHIAPLAMKTYDKFVAHLKGWIDVIRA